VPLSFGPSTIEGVLLDLDEVAVPFLSPAAWQWAWRPQGPVLGERRVLSAVRRSLRAWDRRRWRGLTGREPRADVPALRDHLQATLTAVAGHPLPEAEADAVVRRILRPAGEVETFPDVAPALARLTAAGVRVGIATELPTESAVWLLKRAGIPTTLLKLAGEAAPGLPDRAAFRAAAAELELPHAKVAFVGDLFWSDVRAAGRAGLAAVLLDRYDTWPKVQSGRITTLAALESALAAGGHAAEAGDAPADPEAATD
jgi:HAD superfamily hydrolase (TIGR01549 family)